MGLFLLLASRPLYAQSQGYFTAISALNGPQGLDGFRNQVDLGYGSMLQPNEANRTFGGRAAWERSFGKPRPEALDTRYGRNRMVDQLRKLAAGVRAQTSKPRGRVAAFFREVREMVRWAPESRGRILRSVLVENTVP